MTWKWPIYISTCIYISVRNYSVRNALFNEWSFWIGYEQKYMNIPVNHIATKLFRCFTCCDQNINPGTLGLTFLSTFIGETILAATTWWTLQTNNSPHLTITPNFLFEGFSSIDSCKWCGFGIVGHEILHNFATKQLGSSTSQPSTSQALLRPSHMLPVAPGGNQQFAGCSWGVRRGNNSGRHRIEIDVPPHEFMFQIICMTFHQTTL